MNGWRSDAVTAAANGLAQYSEQLDLKGEAPAAARVLDEVRQSSDQLHFSKVLLRVSQLHPTRDHALAWVREIVATDAGREYLAIGYAWDGLHRAEKAVSRLENLLSNIPIAAPPDRSMERLEAVASMYVVGFDLGCIALCRAIVEQMVEEFAAPEDIRDKLGAAIARLRDTGTKARRKLTRRQAEDMFFINDQAREVLHDEKAREPLDALRCLVCLSRLLGELHSTGGEHQGD